MPVPRASYIWYWNYVEILGYICIIIRHQFLNAADDSFLIHVLNPDIQGVVLGLGPVGMGYWSHASCLFVFLARV